MAAKKIHEYVKGKIGTSNVGPIHFSSNGAQDKNLINISKFQQPLDEKELCPKLNEQEFDSFNSPDQKLQFSSETNDDYSSNTQTPSSTKSSPDSKPKWGTHIEDVKKNINNAVEDAYSVINTLLKDHINKPEARSYDQDSPPMVDKSQQSTIRTSKTMSNIDKVGGIDDSPSELSTYNKSLDNLTIDPEISDIPKPHDGDSVDFKWLPTPKNIKNKSKVRSQKIDSYIPRKIQESLIENHKFPDAKIIPTEENASPFKWLLLIGSLVLVLAMIWLNIQLIFGFSIGLATCLLVLFHFDLLNLQANNRIVSLPALKDLISPSIPHIQQDNLEDQDIHATENSSFSGWINLLFAYDINAYNINHSYVVHLNIEEDKQLRIKRPKRKVARRAMWNEIQYHGVSFSSEIIINLENANIELLPQGLVKKRLWSKKYPICIELPKPLEEYSIEKSNFDFMNPKATKLYLFGRTCREKEEWFRRLLYASSNISIDLNMWNIVQNYLTRKKNSLDEITNYNPLIRQSDSFPRPRSFTAPQTDDESKKVTYHHNSKEDDESQEPIIETHKWKQENKIPKLAEYVKYMSKFMPADMFLLTSEVMRLDINYVTCNPEILCINAFLGRLFWDFLRGSHWVGVLRNKIQCKLKKMHLPQFIDQLTVVDIHLGKEIPLIRKFTRPYLDARGLWFDAEVAYTGGMSMILETKINLFNLKNQLKKAAAEEASGRTGSPEYNSEKLSKDDEDHRPRSHSNGSHNKTAAFMSSEEDSAESSSNSDESGDERPTTTIVSNSNPVGGGGSSKRIIRWVDKIARSPYFIKAADNKYVQRGMELVSNTKLMLQVEVHSVSGTLALNIPPPPSDRLWYGFRPSPTLRISAKPKVGQKEISISKITDLIEKKLILEFQKVLVLPNMDDVPLPLLINGNPDDYCSNL